MKFKDVFLKLLLPITAAVCIALVPDISATNRQEISNDVPEPPHSSGHFPICSWLAFARYTVSALSKVYPDFQRVS